MIGMVQSPRIPTARWRLFDKLERLSKLAVNKVSRLLECLDKKGSAYLKATRVGIGSELDQLTGALVPGKPARLRSDFRDTEGVHRWCIQALTVSAAYGATMSAEILQCSAKQFVWKDISLPFEKRTDVLCVGRSLHV